MKKNIYYWSPFLTKIATLNAVINSVESINKFSNKEYDCSIINAVGEFNFYKEEALKKRIKIIDMGNSNLFKYLPQLGFIKSRFSFLIIFLKCFFPLKKTIQESVPDYIIIHLISSLPLVLLLLFNFKTKFILRISGLPKLNFFRKILWKLCSNKIYKISCPTKGTYNFLLKSQIFEEQKLVVIKDPIININKIKGKKFEKIEKRFEGETFLLAIGRLTKQKNFIFLVHCFKEIIKKHPNIKLLILGEGEEKEKILDFLSKNDLNKSVFLLGHKTNVNSYLSQCKMFILSSLWEDPGFVLVEAIFNNATILSSDCDNGPKEILQNGKAGYLFNSNSKESFLNMFETINIENKQNIYKKKVNAKKNIVDFTNFRHFKAMKVLLGF